MPNKQSAHNIERADVQDFLAVSKKDLKNDSVLKASRLWKTISNQLSHILGDEVYKQWFQDVVPLFLSDNNLILQTNNKFDSMWINNNYQELTDLLIGFQEPSVTSFFLSPEDASKIDMEKMEI